MNFKELLMFELIFVDFSTQEENKNKFIEKNEYINKKECKIILMNSFFRNRG